MSLIHNITSVNDVRILTFGDTHGRDVWKRVIEKEFDKVDLIIFLGDYFTSREGISEHEQVENFRNILAFKNEHPDKVVLLRGNHDMEAIGYEWAYCRPSFRGTWVMENAELFLENTQWLVKIGDVVFSHAGITQRWFEDLKKVYPQVTEFEDINNIEPSQMFGFRSCKLSDYYGDTPTQPLTWVRPACLCEYGYPDITYVVGHTTNPSIVNHKDELIEKFDLKDFAKCNVWLCDTLPREYLIIDHGKFIPVEIE